MALVALRAQLFSYAITWCRDAALAEDICQDTLLAIWNRGYAPEEYARVAYRVARNRWIDECRRNSHVAFVRDADDGDEVPWWYTVADPEPSSEELVVRVEEVNEAIAAFNDLSAADRTILYSYYCSGLPLRSSTAKGRIARARNHLKSAWTRTQGTAA